MRGTRRGRCPLNPSYPGRIRKQSIDGFRDADGPCGRNGTFSTGLDKSATRAAQCQNFRAVRRYWHWPTISSTRARRRHTARRVQFGDQDRFPLAFLFGALRLNRCGPGVRGCAEAWRQKSAYADARDLRFTIVNRHLFVRRAHRDFETALGARHSVLRLHGTGSRADELKTDGIASYMAAPDSDCALRHFPSRFVRLYDQELQAMAPRLRRRWRARNR